MMTRFTSCLNANAKAATNNPETKKGIYMTKTNATSCDDIIITDNRTAAPFNDLMDDVDSFRTILGQEVNGTNGFGLSARGVTVFTADYETVRRGTLWIPTRN